MGRWDRESAAGPLGELGGAARLLGGVEGGGADRYRRRFGGARGRQRRIDPRLELAQQRGSRVLGQQPFLGGIAPGSLHGRQCRGRAGGKLAAAERSGGIDFAAD